MVLLFYILNLLSFETDREANSEVPILVKTHWACQLRPHVRTITWILGDIGIWSLYFQLCVVFYFQFALRDSVIGGCRKCVNYSDIITCKKFPILSHPPFIAPPKYCEDYDYLCDDNICNNILIFHLSLTWTLFLHIYEDIGLGKYK